MTTGLGARFRHATARPGSACADFAAEFPDYAWTVARSGRILPAELAAAAFELALQALHDRAVHLADAAFAQVERRADLFHRQLFVVVQNDDQPLVAVQALGNQPHQVGLLDSTCG